MKHSVEIKELVNQRERESRRRWRS